jgi:hypothetical protein
MYIYAVLRNIITVQVVFTYVFIYDIFKDP